MEKVTKDMIIADILEVDRELARILMNHGMNCVGCPSARGETLEQAAAVHGMEVDEIIEEMNVFLSAKSA